MLFDWHTIIKIMSIDAKRIVMFAQNIEGLSHLFFQVLTFFQWTLTLTGILIVIRGGLRAAYIFFTGCMFQSNACIAMHYDEIRIMLGSAIIVGLEFILAADVISTITLPDYYNLGLLAILVFIRTVLNYFLDKELHRLRGFASEEKTTN